MAQPCGRGWLDLQRYAILAASQLGKEYYPVEMALRAALRAYLGRRAGDRAGHHDGRYAHRQQRNAAVDRGGNRGRRRRPAAAAPARGSRCRASASPRRWTWRVPAASKTPWRCSAAQVEQERSLRGRFRLRTQLCSILVDAGREQIAQPILEELLAQVDAFKLEDWENGQMVAEPMSLLYRVLHKFESDEHDARQPLSPHLPAGPEPGAEVPAIKSCRARKTVPFRNPCSIA